LCPGYKSFAAGCILLLLIGCAGVKPTPAPQPPPQDIPQETPAPPEPVSPEGKTPEPAAPPPEAPETTEVPRETFTPRALASLELSKQAQFLIDEGKFNEAIRKLEQAVNLHPGNGEYYYYLAEAWRLKGNAPQASEYNILASIRLGDDPEWTTRIDLQKKRIEQMR
jgi:tetratricopeptide (TPR) repeat protein